MSQEIVNSVRCTLNAYSGDEMVFSLRSPYLPFDIIRTNIESFHMISAVARHSDRTFSSTRVVSREKTTLC